MTFLILLVGLYIATLCRHVVFPDTKYRGKLLGRYFLNSFLAPFVLVTGIIFVLPMVTG